MTSMVEQGVRCGRTSSSTRNTSNDIERLAITSENKWEKGMAAFCKPFTTAKVRYFDHICAAEARDWLVSLIVSINS